MSIVRYKNKKTGAVSVYESTSHYDPKTKQSRPVRKYLGREDPVTGELIPSTGKRGRQKASRSTDFPDESFNAGNIAALNLKHDQEITGLKALINEQAKTIRKMEVEKASIVRKLSDLLNELSG